MVAASMPLLPVESMASSTAGWKPSMYSTTSVFLHLADGGGGEFYVVWLDSWGSHRRDGAGVAHDAFGNEREGVEGRGDVHAFGGGLGRGPRTR